jgi:hypothetical protein
MSSTDIPPQNKALPLLLAVVLLVVYLAFTAGFTFAHGLCCGDDADLALKAKLVLDGDLRYLYAGFDPHVGVILPVAALVRLVGPTSWAPGLAVLLYDALLLVLIGFLVQKYLPGYRFPLAVGSFFFLNYAFLSLHFEQWYAALGEVPAGLLILAAVLTYYRSDNLGWGVLAGALLLLAILTKLAAVVALLAFLAGLILQGLLAVFRGEKRSGWSFLGRAGTLGLGLSLPAVGFVIYYIRKTGRERTLNRILNSGSYILKYLERHGYQNLLAETAAKSALFRERFGIPFLLFLALIFLAGWLIRRRKDLIGVYSSLLAVILFYSAWWFYFSVGWGRHYVVPLLIGIFILTLPLRDLPEGKYRFMYPAVLLACSAFSWGNLSTPLETLDAGLYRPTRAALALQEIPAYFEDYQEGELVLTKRHGTFEAIQYVTDKELLVRYFQNDQQYAPPLWIAIQTEWVAVNEDFLGYANKKEFKNFLSRCRGLQELEGYLVGECR